MTRDELEYSISQYLDGTLAPLQRQALEARLASDPEARGMLEEYRELDAQLRQHLPMPAVKWDRLAAHLSQVVAREEPPVRRYSIAWVRWTSRVAIAASLLLAAGVGFVTFLTDRAGPQETGYVRIEGPRAELAAGPVVESVQIGPPSTAADAEWQARELVVARPARVIITGFHEPAPQPEWPLY